jgi:hypothetical protein
LSLGSGRLIYHLGSLLVAKNGMLRKEYSLKQFIPDRISQVLRGGELPGRGAGYTGGRTPPPQPSLSSQAKQDIFTKGRHFYWKKLNINSKKASKCRL